jgi:hypothetical protein
MQAASLCGVGRWVEVKAFITAIGLNHQNKCKNITKIWSPDWPMSKGIWVRSNPAGMMCSVELAKFTKPKDRILKNQN